MVVFFYEWRILFVVGLDLVDNKDINFQELVTSDKDPSRKAFFLRQKITYLQESFNALEKVSKMQNFLN